MSPSSFITAVGLVIGVMLGGAAPAASAQEQPTVAVAPASVAVGEVTTVTATGLGGLETAFFGLGDPSAGALSVDKTTFATTAEVPVSNGTAVVYFRGTAAGTVTIAVGTGETSIAQGTVTVTGSAPAGAIIELSTSSPKVGEPVTITAKNLGGLESARFGTGASAQQATITPSSSPVSAGTATATFTATQPGTYSIDVTDGETPLASTDITVTGSSPTPSATPSAVTTPSSSATPAPAPASDGIPLGLIIALAVLILAVIGLVIALVVRSRKAGSTT
ncbi:hypothetical protein CVS47_03207 [Microbacterium lemovicicum]|uniref:Uncharacterized protein n=1 Tax=Microbacterium lemovicicum TaxID=1072463 RepID=A0A3S9WEN1_9MICO|nr:hypothetical protein [Microbacterium lemovicicum]AZS38549.1 hypothetical protein CVS47_03207 [Microbacterium lemovicicum]